MINQNPIRIFIEFVSTKVYMRVLLLIWYIFFIRIANSHGFWRLTFDEVYSIRIGLESFSNLFYYTLLENSPPLFYLFLKIWIWLFGYSDIVLQLFPLVGLALIIVAVYYLQKVLWDNTQTSQITMWLFVISPTVFYFSTELRMYTLVIAFALGTFYFSWKYLQTRSNIFLYWYLFGMFLTGMLHYGAWLPLFAHFLFVLVVIKRYTIKRRQWLLWNMIPALPLLTYVAVSFYIRGRLAINPLEHWSFIITKYDYFIPGILEEGVFTGISTNFIPTLVYFGLLCVAIFFFFYRYVKRKDIKMSFVLKNKIDKRIWVFILLFFPIFIGYLFHQQSSRFYVVSLTMQLLLIGHLLTEVSSNIIRNFFLSLIIIYSVFFLVTYGHLLKAVDWESLVVYVEETADPNDLVLINLYNQEIVFDWYRTRDDLIVKGFFPNNIDYDFRDVVLYNSFLNVNESTVGALGEYTEGYERVFFVSGPSIKKGSFWGAYHIVEWFDKNGWEEKSAEPFSFYFDEDYVGFVFEYVRK